MKSSDESSSFYSEVINLIDLDDNESAINYIKKNIELLRKTDDIALAYLNCGFLNNKMGNHISAIDDFSKSIYFESKLEIINKRSKDVAFNGRSNSRYQNGDYKGAIEDKRKGQKMRLLELHQSSKISNVLIDFKTILLGTFIKKDLDLQYKTLIKVSKISKGKYDLIEDYKKVISNKRKEEVRRKLEFLSESKYKYGDYKASIRAIRRAEKYY